MLAGVVASSQKGAPVTNAMFTEVSSSYSASVSTTNLSLVLNSTEAAGDLAVFAVAHRSALTLPAGLTLIDTLSVTGSGATQWLSWYSKILVAGDVGATMTFAQASAGRMHLRRTVHRKTDPAKTPVLVTKNIVATANASFPNMPIAGVTSTEGGQLMLSALSRINANDSSAAEVTTPPTGLTLIPPASDAAIGVRLAIAFKSSAGVETLSGAFRSNSSGTVHFVTGSVVFGLS